MEYPTALKLFDNSTVIRLVPILSVPSPKMPILFPLKKIIRLGFWAEF